jgi:hypothetical protein
VILRLRAAPQYFLIVAQRRAANACCGNRYEYRKGGQIMDAQVQAAAALYLLLTPKQKDEMLALIERILAEEEQKIALEPNGGTQDVV